MKTTAVRLIPVIGKDVGDTAEFGGLLGYAPIVPVNEYDCSAFVSRKGRIPAPVHSFKNLEVINKNGKGSNCYRQQQWNYTGGK